SIGQKNNASVVALLNNIQVAILLWIKKGSDPSEPLSCFFVGLRYCYLNQHGYIVVAAMILTVSLLSLIRYNTVYHCCFKSCIGFFP
nr:hypothetical protein [Tanacetum cinerariifolium]